MDDAHRRPETADDHAVAAAGKVSEAFEWIERARGHLYSVHQLIGRADFLAGDAADMLDAAGRHDLAETVRSRLVGRNVLDGRWTFQVVEEFDDGYYADARDVERIVREDLVAGRRHVYEAELKEKRRSPNRLGHEARPSSAYDRTVSTEADFDSA